MSAPMDVAMDGSLVSDRLAKTDSTTKAPLDVAPLIRTTTETSMQIDARVDLQPDAAPGAAEGLQPVQALLEYDTVSGRDGDVTETTNIIASARRGDDGGGAGFTDNGAAAVLV